jgi:hypothetical protein
MELQKTATSHLELSDQLNKKVTSEFEQKLDEYRLLLEKWTKTLDELYNERQEKTIELLKVGKRKLFDWETMYSLFLLLDSCKIFKGTRYVKRAVYTHNGKIE